MAKAPAPAIERVRRISSGAYATLDSASLANTGNAIRLGNSVCCSLSERNGLPSSSRLARDVELATSAKGTGGRHRAYPAPRAVPRESMRPSPCEHRIGGTRTLHVVIMGCGRLGSTLAQPLDRHGGSVAVIDQNADAFRRLPAEFGGPTVTGSGFDRDVLRAAGVERADSFAAVSSGDNSNIISSRLARETFGVSR